MGLRSALSVALACGLTACSGGGGTSESQRATTDAGKKAAPRPTATQPATGQVADLGDEDEGAMADQPTQISGSFLVDCVPLAEDVPFLDPNEAYIVGGCTITDAVTNHRPKFTKVTLQAEDGTVIESESLRPAPDSGYDFFIQATAKQLEGKLVVLFVTAYGALDAVGSTSKEDLLKDTDNVGERFLWLAFGTYINEQLDLPTAPLSLAAEARHLIFVTHKLYPGDLGGLKGADQICQDLGTAHVDDQKVWIALLSSSDDSASKRFKAEGPIYNLMGELVADASDLWTKQLAAAVRYTEKGFDTDHRIDLKLFNALEVGLHRDTVWTGSDAGGQSDPRNCKDWTSTEFADRATGGVSRAKDLHWFAEQVAEPQNTEKRQPEQQSTEKRELEHTCARGARIYCISQ